MVVSKDLFLARKENGGETHKEVITHIQKEDFCVCVCTRVRERERERERERVEVTLKEK